MLSLNTEIRMENDQLVHTFCFGTLRIRNAALDDHFTPQSTVHPDSHRGYPSLFPANESVAMSSSVMTMLADPTVQIAFACVLISLAVGELVFVFRALWRCLATNCGRIDLDTLPHTFWFLQACLACG